MNIREMKLADYEKVDVLMQKLHELHVTGRPDLFIEMEHPYSLEEYRKMITDENIISILAEEEAKARGAKRLDLMLWAFNESAAGFYEEMGMKTQRYILEKAL